MKRDGGTLVTAGWAMRFIRAVVILVLFPLIGSILCMVIGAAEGGVAGGILGAFDSDGSGFWSRIGGGAIAGGAVGGFVGFYSGAAWYFIAAIASFGAPSARQVLLQATRGGVVQSARGVVVGGAIGLAAAFGLLVILTTFYSTPFKEAIGDALGAGAAWGTLAGGFCGLLIGTLKAAHNEILWQRLQMEIEENSTGAQPND